MKLYGLFNLILYVGFISATCTKYKVLKGDHAYGIAEKICIKDACEKDDGYPYVENTKGVKCPKDIEIGETMTVCCSAGNGKVDPKTKKPTSKGKSGKCPDSRTVKPGDSVFLTIDDGPSKGSRRHLLKAFKEAEVKVTFFESGYNLCNDLEAENCQKWAYKHNVESLAQTVKAGHMLAAHSDNHFYDAKTDKCTYLGVKPQVRPASRVDKCSNEPIQNMVQGAHQVQAALESNLVKWTDEEALLKEKAIDDVWTYSRLPCSDIWRTRGGISETNLPGVSNKKEIALRNSIADSMFSGEVKCRPEKYNKTPWENYGFDSLVDWKGKTVLNEGEACRVVKLIEDNIEDEPSAKKKGKLVLLTHDYYFNSEAKAQVFKDVAMELVRKGYKLKTMEDFHPKPKSKGKEGTRLGGSKTSAPKSSKAAIDKSGGDPSPSFSTKSAAVSSTFTFSFLLIALHFLATLQQLY